MKAIQLTGFNGVESLLQIDLPTPKPLTDEVLIKVQAAGINYAEVEQIHGNYLTFGKEIPFVMGFEVAGEVAEIGSEVTHLAVGDKVTGFSISGGFAEYSTAKADTLIPIPNGLTFGQATTIPIQGMTAYTMLKYLVVPNAPESILIQAAAGGVGLYLVQLAKHFGIKNIIALASSDDKLELIKSLGAHVVINYSASDWVEKVKEATSGKGVDVVLQMLLGSIGEESFKLVAPNGKIVLFGSKNYNDTITTEQVRQLIWSNQTLAGFAYPALPIEKITESLPEFLELVSTGKIKIFADHNFQLEEAKEAFVALASRKTIGKVYFSFPN
ncbi:quinone oxidoreductase family protein [Flavobacterium sp. UBA7682]|uniref:quinone oxidoreductase family protein n=1 Tax=Flavobacterium sp. UBA7682 TaxID=1946560 RepID=UPI0025C62AA1|nr:NADPH:quinone oxidoreductase family protein [Flavobacterium sp. UBA7682]